MTIKSDNMVPMYHLELVREKASFPYTKVSGVEAAAEVFHQLLDSSHVEKMAVIYCNAGGEMIGAEVVAIGKLTNVGADMSDIFKGALLANAYSIWFAHNHPGAVGKEKAEASVPDYLFTTKLLEASEIMGILLEDHLVIQPGSHYSIKDNMRYLSEKAQRELEKVRNQNPLIQLLGGMAADKSAVEKMMSDTPWDRGINHTWEKTSVGCPCGKCAARRKKSEKGAI